MFSHAIDSMSIFSNKGDPACVDVMMYILDLFRTLWPISYFNWITDKQTNINSIFKSDKLDGISIIDKHHYGIND